MFRLDSLILFGNIALICISFTHSIPLDISCEDDIRCGGIGAKCRDRKCQCDTPYYTPCGTTNCNVRDKFVYEGDFCRVDGNCMENARCSEIENRCRCLPDYSETNGLCYKNLNAHCMSSSECWSNECRGNICQCPLGSTPRGDNRRCRHKLSSIYPNWSLANMTGDFCYGNGHYSCLFRSAVCQSDSQHVEKFCQCPSTHIADYEKQECHPREYDGLSPSINPLPVSPCGKCRVENAVCADVAKQTTCWCRAGFNNTGNQCEKSGKVFIFPNQNDIHLRDYTSNCSASKINGLCSCSPGQFFNDRTRSCQSIEPQWENEKFEYGVCTRINSFGRAVEEGGLCPHPLKCEAREDKYVCSCGPDRYLDEKHKSCHYYLERPLTNPIGSDCPLHSTLNGNVCQCHPPNIFKLSNDSKHCQLVLNGTSLCEVPNPTGDSLCEQFYGGNARFCRQGECLCQQNTSYEENNRCITLIGEKAGNHANCPLNAKNSSGICKCQDGYRVENEKNRTCVRKVNSLNETRADLIFEDCQALFPKQPIQLVNSSCRCEDAAFSNGSACVPYLGARFTNPSEMICPEFAIWESDHCQCFEGYKTSDNKICNRWTENVYQHNDTTGVNTMGINDTDCKALFGSAAEKSDKGDFCHCREANTSYFDDNTCYFLVNTTIDRIDSCPSNSKINNNRCDCLPGYKPKLGNQGCELKSISTSKLQAIDIETYGGTCNSTLTNDDCQALFGAGAVCRDGQCYCDRKRSYVHHNRCVLFSDLIFPGAHQRHLYACESVEDCGKDAKKNGIDCKLIDENYHVCQCQQGYYFNPIDYTCVPSQCYPLCSLNEICENYQCICPVGFYRDSSRQCVKFGENLKVHDGCNASYWSGSVDEDLKCSENCQRVECASGYEDQGTKCAKKTFGSRCVNGGDICLILNPNSICDRDENRCVCGPDYYQPSTSETCVRPVGFPCIHPDECGQSGECLNRTCVCKINYKKIDSNDHFGRKIQICVNGMGQLRFDFLILLFVVVVRIFFA